MWLVAILLDSAALGCIFRNFYTALGTPIFLRHMKFGLKLIVIIEFDVNCQGFVS